MIKLGLQLSSLSPAIKHQPCRGLLQASTALPLSRRPPQQQACTRRRRGKVAVSASLQSITASPWYSTWLQSAVVLVILGAVDAAYSGDWSRIGVLTTGQESEIKELLGTLAQFHAFCIVVAAVVAAGRGNGLKKTCAGCLKVAAVGFLALVEVTFSPKWDGAAASKG